MNEDMDDLPVDPRLVERCGMPDMVFRLLPVRTWKRLRARWIAVRDAAPVSDPTPWTFGVGWTRKRAARNLRRKEAALRRGSWFDDGIL